MRAFRRYFYRIINAVSYFWYKLMFAINCFLDEKIIARDEILRAKIQGVAISTGRKLKYSDDEITASNKRKHTLALNREEVPSSIPQAKSSKNSASKIVHVVNLFIPSQKNKSLFNRTTLAIQSIEEAIRFTENVEILGCSSIALKRAGWKTRILIRNAANTIGHNKDFLYLKDMFDAAAELAGDDDYILYSNLDCQLTRGFYKNLFKNNSDIVEYVRRNCPETKSLKEIFSGESWPYTTGRDAFAFKKKTYLSIREYIPDFIIGEPHWDTALSGICQKLHSTSENLSDLYHIDHPKEWDINSLTIGGQYNQSLFAEAKADGLTDIDLLSVQKKTGLVIYNHDHSKLNLKKLTHFLDRHMDCEIVIIDLLKKEKDLQEDLLDTNYYPIIHRGRHTLALNQETALKNLGMHLLEGFEKIKFISLKDLNKRDYKGEVHKVKTLKPFDYFSINEQKHKNIRSRSYLNDEGLLQLC